MKKSIVKIDVQQPTQAKKVEKKQEEGKRIRYTVNSRLEVVAIYY